MVPFAAVAPHGRSPRHDSVVIRAAQQIFGVFPAELVSLGVTPGLLPIMMILGSMYELVDSHAKAIQAPAIPRHRVLQPMPFGDRRPMLDVPYNGLSERTCRNQRNGRRMVQGPASTRELWGIFRYREAGSREQGAGLNHGMCIGSIPV